MRAESTLLLLITGIAMAVFSLLSGCDYGRMYDQDVIKTFKKKVPDMDKRTVPLNDGFAALTTADPETLKNPLRHTPSVVERGRVAYGYFCIPCHGERLDGRGTVGQSFTPLPTNLASQAVLSRSDGLIYSRIRLGFRRHPLLFPTVSENDSWAIIVYMRSLKSKS